MRRWGAEADGQASVELVAVLPVATAVALAAAQVLAAGWSAELAGHAAEAGAIALGREEDPGPRHGTRCPAGRATASASGSPGGPSAYGFLHRPSCPGLAGALTATAHADAGPRP
jgi:hypothetical protein